MLLLCLALVGYRQSMFTDPRYIMRLVLRLSPASFEFSLLLKSLINSDDI